MNDETGKPLSPQAQEAQEYLERYKNRIALQNGDFKRVFEQYFEAAKEFKDRTGEEPTPIIFNLTTPPKR